MRLGEALALRQQDLDFDRSLIRVLQSRTRGRTGTPKSGTGRTVPMTPELAHELASLAQRPLATADADLVFIWKRAGHLDVNRFRLRSYEAQAKAGSLRVAPFIQLRHTFATVCASGGVHLRTIQGWCGHEDYMTTERYAHFLPRHEDAALVSAAFRRATEGVGLAPVVASASDP